jgi:hypothetical protein
LRPRLLSWADAVAEIAQAAGRRISYLPVSLEEYATLLTENQVSADVVKMLTDVFTEVLDGHNAYLTDGVQRALGRPPRTSPTTPGAPPAPGFGRWRHERRDDPAHRGRRGRLSISLQPWKGSLWGSDSQLET